MANENQNTGPNTQGSSQGPSAANLKDLRQGLRELLEDQGDFNNLLKNSIADLKRMDNAYGRIEARLNSLNKDTVNVKQINQELLRLRQKEFIEGKKLSDLEKDFGTDAKNALELAKANTVQLMKDAELLGIQESYEENMLKYLKDTGNLEAVALYTAEKQLEIAQKNVAIGKQELEKEKELRKQIGFSGAAFKLFSDKLGVGTEFYEKMVLKARQLQEEGKKITFTDKLSIFAKTAGAGIKEVFKDPLAFFAALPLAGAAIGALVKGLKSVLDFILEIQDKTVKFARAMNLSTAEARRIKMEFADLSISSGDLFITSQKMVESQMELTDALGVTNRLNSNILATNIKLKDITGLDLETRKGIAETSVITGQSSDKITKSVLAQVVGLKNATGISFQYQRILKEASNLGGYLGLSFSKYPAQLTKSLLTVKAMGMELKQLDSIADSFLDFESSISKEFEAQLLTGKDINLAKAREAFLNNDLATAAGEITRQVGSAADFLKLNRIQAESLASAFGMSRDQMGEMLRQQEILAKLGAKQGDSAREQLRLGLERYKTQKALAAAVGDEAYQSLVNASAQEKIGAFMDKIKQSIADFVEKSGIIEKLEGFFDYLSKPENIKKVIEGVRDFFASAVEFIGKAAYYILEGLDYVAFGQIPDSFIDSIKEGAANMGAQIRSMGGDLGGVSVGGNKAESQVKTETIKSVSEVSNNSNRLASPPEVYILVTVDPDTGAKVQKRISRDVYERQFGQMANQFKPS